MPKNVIHIHVISHAKCDFIMCYFRYWWEYMIFSWTKTSLKHCETNGYFTCECKFVTDCNILRCTGCHLIPCSSVFVPRIDLWLLVVTGVWVSMVMKQDSIEVCYPYAQLRWISMIPMILIIKWLMMMIIMVIIVIIMVYGHCHQLWLNYSITSLSSASPL